MHRTFLKAIALILSALLLFPVLFACTRRNAGSEEKPADATSAPVGSPSPTSGGLLRMAMPENMSVGNPNYDPLIIKTEEEMELYSLVYEPLIAIDEQNALVPCLAAKWSRQEGRDKTWIVTLRGEAKFHSGEPLRADDVIYTWQRLRELGSESYYYSSVSPIRSIAKLDADTVAVTMKSSGFSALYALSFPIVKAGSPFNGTGAYRVESYNDEHIKLQANADWWDRTPYISSVELFARDSNDTALASFGAGQLDLVPTAQLSAGKYREDGVTKVYNYMTQGMETLLFNHRRGLLMQKEFRKAIAHSINRGRIITNVYMNKAQSCDVPVPPDSFLYDPASTQFDYNPNSADKLFSSLGYEKHSDGLLYSGFYPIELTLLVSSTAENTTGLDAATTIAAQLLEAGIQVNVITYPHGYGEDESEFMAALLSMDWDIALVGFNLNIANDLTPYLSEDGSCNYGHFPGNVFEDSLENIRLAEDEQALRMAFLDFQKQFTDQLPFLVLYFRLNCLVCTEKLGGIDAIREPALLRNIKNWYIKTE